MGSYYNPLSASAFDEIKVNADHVWPKGWFIESINEVISFCKTLTFCCRSRANVTNTFEFEVNISFKVLQAKVLNGNF